VIELKTLINTRILINMRDVMLYCAWYMLVALTEFLEMPCKVPYSFFFLFRQHCMQPFQVNYQASILLSRDLAVE